jgi:hypothetical protein
MAASTQTHNRTAVVSSASEEPELRAIMEIRARGANRLHDLEGQRCYRHAPAPVRPVRHDLVSSLQSSGQDDRGETDYACGSSDLKGCWCAQTAHTMRASLFATAIAVTL